MKAKYLLNILALFLTSSVYAQFSNTKISINGLTCSQCSKSVEMQILKLPWVKSVNMDLANTEAEVQLKLSKEVDFEKLAKAVKNAGFSVESITCRLDLNKMENTNNQCYTYNEFSFWITDSVSTTSINVQFLGKSFGTKSSEAIYSICPGKKQYIVKPL